MSLAIKQYCQQKRYPTTVQKFYHLTPVWTQFPDNVGYQTCLSIAAADLLTICYYRDRGLNIPLSPQILIDHCEDCTQDEQVFEYMKTHGLTTIDNYPFIGMKHSHPVQLPHQEAKIYYLPNSECHLSIIDPLPDSTSEIGKKIVQTLVDENLPLLGTFAVAEGSNFENWEPRNPPYCPDGSIKANRAAVIVGYDFSSRDNNDHCFYIKNSYGINWGDEGYGRIKVGYFRRVRVPKFD